MPRRIPAALCLALPVAFFLYLFDLGAVGLFGPDEPRYASIAREMARSGDWITPRLWGHPWFEKPALLYWMEGAAFRAGLGTELAPRLPVALMALAFLGFYWWILRREFGCRAAWMSTIVLGTSAGFVFSSQVGTTDLPLTVTFSAAMLLALPWVGRRDARFLPAAAVLLGLSVLAKLLLPMALVVLWWGRRGRFRDLARPRIVLPFLAVALPWYTFCYLRNGWAFISTLFVQHQLGRFTSGALMHAQPWWFYLPILAGLAAPWTPLLPLLARRAGYRDPRRLFLLAWALSGLLFFSISVNKLPLYVLPLLPAVAALLGVALDEIADARPWLAGCAVLLVVYPVAAPMLPAAVAMGTSKAALPAFHWFWLLPLVVAGAVWVLESSRLRLAAVCCLAVAGAAGVVYLKSTAAPDLDRMASARAVWREIGARAGEVCVGDIGRLRYALNYYSETPLPDCAGEPKPIEVRQGAGRGAYVEAATHQVRK